MRLNEVTDAGAQRLKLLARMAEPRLLRLPLALREEAPSSSLGFWASWAGPTQWTTGDFTICRLQSRLEHPSAWRILRQFRESSLVVSLGDIWRWVHLDLPFPTFVGLKAFSTVRNNLEKPLMKFQMIFLRQYFHVVKARNVIFSKKWC